MSSADNATATATATAAPSPKSAAAAKEDNNPSSGNRKTTSSSRPPEQALKCPRCDSPNTKFCYYNNYSLTQPRHFCKTCRRYWTKGGALRNVPVGGGCRKNKKIKSSSRLISGGTGTDSKDSSSSSSDHHHFGGGLNLKFFHGISPAMDFQLGGLNSLIPSTHHSRHQNPSSTSTGIIYNPLSSSNSTTSFGDSLASNNASPLMGAFDYPLSLGSGSGSSVHHGFGGAIQGHHNINIVHTNLASSIESLSSINQDLHWKLQQQRLAMLFGGDNSQKDQISTGSGGANSSVLNPLVNQTTTMTQKLMPHHHQQHHQSTVPILFQNLDISKTDDEDHNQQVQARKDVTCGADHTANNMEWFFGNSYGQQAQHHHVTAHQTPTNSGSNGNENVTTWNSSGVQAPWSTSTDLQQFSALP